MATPAKDEKEPIEAERDKSLQFIFRLMIAAIIVIFLISWFRSIDNRTPAWQTFGLSFIIAAAAALCGGLLGFLFGIPRSLQKNETMVSTQDGNRGLGYSNNTNLEQISDWLTKIIVGVSLVQWPSLMNRFNNMATRLSQAFEPGFGTDFSIAYVNCILVFFAISGFLGVYLWSRIYLLKQLINLDWSFQLTSKIKEVVDKTAVKQTLEREIRALQKVITDFQEMKNRVLNLEISGKNKHCRSAVDLPCRSPSE